jgi:hypothetical protein
MSTAVSRPDRSTSTRPEDLGFCPTRLGRVTDWM